MSRRTRSGHTSPPNNATRNAPTPAADDAESNANDGNANNKPSSFMSGLKKFFLILAMGGLFVLGGYILYIPGVSVLVGGVLASVCFFIGIGLFTFIPDKTVADEEDDPSVKRVKNPFYLLTSVLSPLLLIGAVAAFSVLFLTLLHVSTTIIVLSVTCQAFAGLGLSAWFGWTADDNLDKEDDDEYKKTRWKWLLGLSVGAILFAVLYGALSTILPALVFYFLTIGIGLITLSLVGFIALAKSKFLRSEGHDDDNKFVSKRNAMLFIFLALTGYFCIVIGIGVGLNATGAAIGPFIGVATALGFVFTVGFALKQMKNDVDEHTVSNHMKSTFTVSRGLFILSIACLSCTALGIIPSDFTFGAISATGGGATIALLSLTLGLALLAASYGWSHFYEKANDDKNLNNLVILNNENQPTPSAPNVNETNHSHPSQQQVITSSADGEDDHDVTYGHANDDSSHSPPTPHPTVNSNRSDHSNGNFAKVSSQNRKILTSGYVRENATQSNIPQDKASIIEQLTQQYVPKQGDDNGNMYTTNPTNPFVEATSASLPPKKRGGKKMKVTHVPSYDEYTEQVDDVDSKLTKKDFDAL
jgi:hypothetical protein